jgi:hypothetical protein
MALTRMSPVLLIFLRHAGCPFCREALGDISRARRTIEAFGARIVLVHLGDSAGMERLVAKYRLAALSRIPDPERKLYAAFGLARGKPWRMFGPWVWLRGIQAALLEGHGIGIPSADTAQMPGLFLIDGSRIIRRFRHRSIADRPDYASLGIPRIRLAGAP